MWLPILLDYFSCMWLLINTIQYNRVFGIGLVTVGLGHFGHGLNRFSLGFEKVSFTGFGHPIWTLFCPS